MHCHCEGWSAGRARGTCRAYLWLAMQHSYLNIDRSPFIWIGYVIYNHRQYEWQHEMKTSHVLTARERTDLSPHRTPWHATQLALFKHTNLNAKLALRKSDFNPNFLQMELAIPGGKAF